MKIIFKFLFCIIFFSSCQKPIDDIPLPPPPPPGLPFKETPIAFPIIAGIIDEASGIADSKSNAGFLWIHQDSGNPPELSLLSYNGSVLRKVYIDAAHNRDWEDIALGNGPVEGKNYIYIAETGDNNLQHFNYSIYRFVEPTTEDTVYAWDELSFEYPDAPHDAEAMLLDNATKDIYLITKRDAASIIYKLAYPQSLTSTQTATEVGQLSFTGVVSAAISPDGTELLVKTYTNIYYWKRQTGETIEAALQRAPLTLGYIAEPQGEAICFKNDNSAFFTLSEKPSLISSVTLNEYKRN